MIAQFSSLSVQGRPSCLFFEAMATCIPTPEQFDTLHAALGYGDLVRQPPHHVKMKPGGYVIEWQAVAPAVVLPLTLEIPN